MKTLIKNGTIVTATNEYKADILIHDEKIELITSSCQVEADNIIDASGKYVLPGGVDNHTHFECLNSDGVTHSAGYDISYTALLGGTTTVVDFAANEPGLNMVDSVEHRINTRAKDKMALDVAIHAQCTNFTDETLDEIPRLIDIGVPTMKMFTAYKPTSLYMDDEKLIKTMQVAAQYGMTLYVHAENADILNIMRDQYAEKGCLAPKYHYMTRPPYGEAEAISRVLTFGKATKCPICIVHVSCIEAMKVIKEARLNDVAVISETCPHYLVLDKHKMDDPDFEQACRWVCSPPLRDKEDREFLWNAIKNNWIQVVGSDSVGVPMYQKEWGRNDFRAIPNGCPSVGERLNILWTYGVESGKISRQKLVEVYAAGPAKLCGLFPRKGTIDIGADADLVIFDPEYKGTITVENNPTGVEYNIFEGMKQVGRAETVLLRGKVVVDNAKYVGNLKDGQFIPGKPYGSAYDLLNK